MFFQVFLQIFQRLQIGIQTLFLRIGHKDHAVGALQDQFAAGLVEHLAGHRVEVQPRLKAAHGAQIER